MIPFPAKVLDQHAAVLGKTGAGKSSAMRVVVEHLLDHNKRVCVIDPKGDWFGLQFSSDGKSAGYPVITFGDFKGDNYKADVPVNEHSGKHVAELITSGNRPAIIGFRGWFTSHMTNFWVEFAKTLFHANEGELYLIIDEAQNLRSNGWLEGDRNSMQLTAAGVEVLGSYDPLPSGRGLYEYWKSELGQSGAGRMLEVLFEVYPNGLTKSELGERANISHTSGTFGTYLGRLRSLELITGSSELKASAEFFE